MKILLVTQEDSFYIPRLISLLMPERAKDIVGVVILKGEMAKRNIKKYWDFMGPVDFVRYVALYLTYHLLDRLYPRGRKGQFFSVAAVARAHGLPLFEPRSINDPAVHEEFRKLGVDLIVSIAAPQIFKKEILELPEHGCINIHNGLLPKYQGVLPSFWVLANNETHTGTTVHYMNEKIDAGAIILQEKVAVEPEDTLHSLVYRTKITIGPRMLLQAISLVEAGQVPTQETDWSQATYYSFPDAEAVRRFRALGRKFR